MVNRLLLDTAKAALAKVAFVPAGDPQAGGMPPMDPAMGGGMPPPMGGGMPPPMDPAMGGGMPPPMDPAMGGGMPPPPPADPAMGGGGMSPDMIKSLIQQVLQETGGGGATKAKAGKIDVPAEIAKINRKITAVLQLTLRIAGSLNVTISPDEAYSDMLESPQAGGDEPAPVDPAAAGVPKQAAATLAREVGTVGLPVGYSSADLLGVVRLALSRDERQS